MNSWVLSLNVNARLSFPSDCINILEKAHVFSFSIILRIVDGDGGYIMKVDGLSALKKK